MNREIKNGKIIGTTLGHTDRGASFFIDIDYGGSGQGFGGYGLGGTYTHYVVMGILNALHVETWEKLKGVPVRVDADSEKIYRIGHYLEDEWFDPSEHKENE